MWLMAMTLITYPTRVHFADGVLEEALRSELEAHGYVQPLILCEEEDFESDVAERLRSGLPRRTKATEIAIGARDTKYDTARAAETHAALIMPDVIIAFGSARAIAYARKCRHVLYQSRTHQRGAAKPADIFAVPGIDGLPNPCRSSLEPSQTLLDSVSRTGLPNIVICDPTVTGEATNDAAACAATDAFSRCLEAYLSEAYNPPADGIALDGFARAVASLKATNLPETPEARRELMAASLNATLAQQKGIGPTQLIVDILREPYGNQVPSGALARVLLPGVLGSRSVPSDRQARLAQMLAVGTTAPLDEGVEDLLRSLPLAARLSELGLTQTDIVNASEEIEGPLSTAIHTTAAGARSIMEAVF